MSAINEAADVVMKSGRCCLGLMGAAPDGKGTKYGYVILTGRGHEVWEALPDGTVRPWSLTLEELNSDKWIAADRP